MNKSKKAYHQEVNLRKFTLKEVRSEQKKK